MNAMLLFEGGWAVTKSCQTWESFLQNRLLSCSDAFSPKALRALKEIYLTCHVTSQMASEDRITEYKTSGTSDLIDTSAILISAQDIGDTSVGNLMYVFVKALRERTKLGTEEVRDIVQRYGCESQEDSGQKLLHFEGFLHYVKDSVKNEKRHVWKAFLACGYDFNHER